MTSWARSRACSGDQAAHWIGIAVHSAERVVFALLALALVV